MNEIGLPLGPWLEIVLAIANSTGSNPALARLRVRLQQVIDGALPKSSDVVWLPEIGVKLDERGRASLVPHPSLTYYFDLFTKKVKTPGDLLATVLGGFATKHEPKLRAIVYATAADPTRAPLLRRCAQCEKFFFANANHKRSRSFCVDNDDACRRAWDHEHRDPKYQAAYMRNYRKSRAATKRRRKR